MKLKNCLASALLSFACAAAAQTNLVRSNASDSHDGPERSGLIDLISPPNSLQVVLNPRASIVDRVERVHRMGGETLSLEQINVLFEFSRNSAAREENIAALRYLKNEVFALLRVQALAQSNLATCFRSIVQDSAQDLVVRDYALQHMACWYGDGADKTKKTKETIQSVLIETTTNRTRLSGTALLGLHYASVADTTFNTNLVNRLALQIIADPSFCEASRITAIQICAERGITYALPVIDATVRGTADSVLKASAIAAIGKLGNQADLQYLRSLDPQSYLQPAVRASVNRLSARLGPYEKF